MYLKVNYRDLSSIGSYLVEQSEQLNKKIDSMITNLKRLEIAWSGPDYENYKETYETYLKNCKTTSIELNAFGNALKRVSEYYGDCDMDFGIRMRQMVTKNGNEQVKY